MFWNDLIFDLDQFTKNDLLISVDLYHPGDLDLWSRSLKKWSYPSLIGHSTQTLPHLTKTISKTLCMSHMEGKWKVSSFQILNAQLTPSSVWMAFLPVYQHLGSVTGIMNALMEVMKAQTFVVSTTVRVDSLPHRKWKAIKQQPGTAGPGNMLGCCLIYFHFRWGKLSMLTVVNSLQMQERERSFIKFLWSE